MTAKVLVVNSGSSSIKYQLIELPAGTPIARGSVERIGEPEGRVTHHGPDSTEDRAEPVADHAAGMRAMLDSFASAGPDLATVELTAVGHRVVHGGERFTEPTLITDEVCAVIAELSSLAPLHNPANLRGIEVAREAFPEVPHVAVFDTAFHATLPEHAYTYAVPRDWRSEHGVRRYGFHGTSHAYVSRRAAELLDSEPSGVNVIVLHLGNGASVSAVKGGVCVDTSMGLTPLEGLVMGTRSGDVDPAVVFHMRRAAGLSVDELDDALNKGSGLLGLTGVNDMRELLKLVDGGDAEAALAFEVYCYRIRKYVGAYTAALGHVDAIVFTAGVGEHNPLVRETALRGLGTLGIRLDPERNDRNDAVVSAAGSHVAVLVVPTNEELEIAGQALALVEG
ncbi:acetate/propionate family kinase [Phytomonospora endophytica]|uniref:Acetate kinase n=1 Tax=Phytomonospora endophytica TaxID=714109 RepID=A0A841FC91_9ACTN|nr:acetate kinase [Phytomonospora endophytica]MBB6032623.1 acetate kinase [Phytomonospora endophytica]GIG66227.1 acetate kinase [Phytomonospora endophytica]